MNNFVTRIITRILFLFTCLLFSNSGLLCNISKFDYIVTWPLRTLWNCTYIYVFQTVNSETSFSWVFLFWFLLFRKCCKLQSSVSLSTLHSQYQSVHVCVCVYVYKQALNWLVRQWMRTWYVHGKPLFHFFSLIGGSFWMIPCLVYFYMKHIKHSCLEYNTLLFRYLENNM